MTAYLVGGWIDKASVMAGQNDRTCFIGTDNMQTARAGGCLKLTGKQGALNRRQFVAATGALALAPHSIGATGRRELAVQTPMQPPPVNGRAFDVRLAPGCGARLELTMRRYAATPTLKFPWS